MTVHQRKPRTCVEHRYKEPGNWEKRTIPKKGIRGANIDIMIFISKNVSATHKSRSILSNEIK
ncbi:hypothetical protein BGLA2_300058 [Burkholderia gladioli]|nr:hypothetical protein BGLA2_300058 [Burkholderia gladioli]